MVMSLDYKPMPDWPVLSWLAVCEIGTNRVLVFHGQDVQTQPYWFCEAIWDGTYSEGNLDQTDLIFGSGARCRTDRITFVSSGATIDRLQFLQQDGLVLVSNSLACLLTMADLEPDPQFRGYIQLFSSIGRGYKSCDRFVPLRSGAVQLVYFDNLEWDSQALREVPKAVPPRDFSSYEQYIAFLRSSLQRLAANMSTSDRNFTYDWLGSLSRGYDSPAAVALTKEAGLRTALSFKESRPGVEDDGSAIAKALGVEIKLVDRLGWHKNGVWEPPFLCADGQGKEIMLSAAPALLRRRVLVTGNGGDYVWDMNPGSLSTELAHDEYAGLSVTEFRLQGSFIHFPLPYMGMSQVADIYRISRSREMKQWDIGGTYSRPICRRVLEERGVPRGIFGRDKTGGLRKVCNWPGSMVIPRTQSIFAMDPDRSCPLGATMDKTRFVSDRASFLALVSRAWIIHSAKIYRSSCQPSYSSDCPLSPAMWCRGIRFPLGNELHPSLIRARSWRFHRDPKCHCELTIQHVCR